MMPSMNGGDVSQHHHQQQQQLQQQQQWMAMQQYQQQWMAMQYPASMMMQYRMMYGQQQPYMPYHYQQQQLYQHQRPQQQNHSPIQISSEENKTIWIGDLQQWMDEGYLHSCFSHTGEVISVKVIRNKHTGQSEKYGFIEFISHVAAEKVLQSYNGSMMPNSDQTFRLNWAVFSSGERQADTGSDLSIFVGDLALDVTDTLLHETFASKYPSVKGAKVVVDLGSGRSKGYGFVRFGDENERSKAMEEMNGVLCSSRPMRIGIATPKKALGQQQYSPQAAAMAGAYTPNAATPQNFQTDEDSYNNTTIFVGGLSSDVTDEELRQTFSQFGEILSVKIPAGKGCGFIQFSTRDNAEAAMEKLNGTIIGKQTVRLSWGRNPGNKQSRTDSNHQRNGSYNGYSRNGYGGYAPQNQTQSQNEASSNGYNVQEQQPAS